MLSKHSVASNSATAFALEKRRWPSMALGMGWAVGRPPVPPLSLNLFDKVSYCLFATQSLFNGITSKYGICTE
jgi:hypothetical protein